MKKYKHLFGPVPSRRLGRSLGVDLVKFKTCSFDCIFCQLGHTTMKTIVRKEYVPMDSVIEELEWWIKEDGSADYITLSGSGEPTLNSRFDRVIDFVHQNSNIPVAVLTNGSLLSASEVREQASHADLVKVSLSAWDQPSLERINRASPEIDFTGLVEGQRMFRKQYGGEMWMEVFLMWGVNTAPKEVKKIAEVAKNIGPNRIQLNTSVRPPCEDYALPVPEDHMQKLATLFDPPAEVIAEYSTDLSARIQAGEEEIMAMLKRRPCTMDQICESFDLHRNEASKYLGKLTRTGKVQEMRKDDKLYYSAMPVGDNDYSSE
jgi:wyosine [tRNA(Phe)-imidazoG37] synthetase (radical SAM superfamily)